MWIIYMPIVAMSTYPSTARDAPPGFHGLTRTARCVPISCKKTMKLILPRTRLGRLGALVVALNLMGGALGADAKPDVSKLPAPSTRKGLAFDKDVKPLFDKSCAKCHGGDKPKGRLTVETREAVLRGGENGAVLVIGKSEQSRMIHFVADLVPDLEMPPKDKRDRFPALTREQIAVLRAWIDQGAK